MTFLVSNRTFIRLDFWTVVKKNLPNIYILVNKSFRSTGTPPLTWCSIVTWLVVTFVVQTIDSRKFLEDGRQFVLVSRELNPKNISVA